MSKAATVIGFVMGAAVGATVTWFIVKKRYERLAQEEIDSTKEALTRLYKTEDDKNPEVEEVESESSDEESSTTNYYSGAVDALGYGKVISHREPRNDIPKNTTRPFVIAPEEFGEIEEYDKVSLTLFADRVLADDNDEVIHNVEEIVGHDSLNHFGEYEDDSVFVRNDRLRCDYEILLDQRTYAKFLEEHPYKAEV